MGSNTEFKLNGINHLALVSSDMARTVDFYTNVLGMPLIKTLEIPGGAQHFFFDCGNGDSLAFFWFPEAPAAVPGISAAGASGNQKNASESPLPQSKKKCCAPPGISSVLISGIPRTLV